MPWFRNPLNWFKQDVTKSKAPFAGDLDVRVTIARTDLEGVVLRLEAPEAPAGSLGTVTFESTAGVNQELQGQFLVNSIGELELRSRFRNTICELYVPFCTLTEGTRVTGQATVTGPDGRSLGSVETPPFNVHSVAVAYFWRPLILLGLHVIRADGKVTENEVVVLVTTVKSELSLISTDAVLNLIERAPSPLPPISELVSEFRLRTPHVPGIDLIDAMRQLALSDGSIGSRELSVLNEVSVYLGVFGEPTAAYQTLVATGVSDPLDRVFPVEDTSGEFADIAATAAEQIEQLHLESARFWNEHVGALNQKLAFVKDMDSESRPAAVRALRSNIEALATFSERCLQLVENVHRRASAHRMHLHFICTRATLGHGLKKPEIVEKLYAEDSLKTLEWFKAGLKRRSFYLEQRRIGFHCCFDCQSPEMELLRPLFGMIDEVYGSWGAALAEDLTTIDVAIVNLKGRLATGRAESDPMPSLHFVNHLVPDEPKDSEEATLLDHFGRDVLGLQSVLQQLRKLEFSIDAEEEARLEVERILGNWSL